MTISFFRAALVCGWRIAILKEETPLGQQKAVAKKLGLYLLVTPFEVNGYISVNNPISASPNVLPDLEACSANPPYQWHEDECAVILFTSGSTGSPKGVCHSLGNIVRSAELFIKHFRLEPGSIILCLAPIHSMSGLRCLLIPCISQISVETPSDSNFLRLIGHIEKTNPDYILCGPVLIKQLAAYGKRILNYLTSIKAIFCTGADLDENDRDMVQNIFRLPILNYYGLTETSGIVLAETPEKQNSGCLPPPCEEVKVDTLACRTGNDLHHLIIGSPNIFLGYLGETLQRKSFFDTGDIVSLTTNNRLILQGRSSGGVKAPSTELIYPFLLERWLKSEFNALDFVVTAITVPGGYGLKVAVQSPYALNTDELNGKVNEYFGPDYIPHEWEYSEIDRSPLGKLLTCKKQS